MGTKVGDIVRIRHFGAPTTDPQTGVYFSDGMLQFCGMLVRVTAIGNEPKFANYTLELVDESELPETSCHLKFYTFTDFMLVMDDYKKFKKKFRALTLAHNNKETL